MNNSNAWFLKLFLVVVVAITCGNLLSNWIGLEFVAYKTRKAAEARTDELERKTQEIVKSSRELMEKIEADKSRRKAEIEARADDATGRKLAQACSEAEEMVARPGGERYKRDAERACAKRYFYVELGILK
ncbi:MAG: hypothetical protein JNJ71_12610 [Rubrivivax sp.]|nr:hypothetical protein [Rubrivivax sp.]